jgi:phosphoglycerate dehydrogenase-like enzyme
VATLHIGYVERDGRERMFDTTFEQVLCFERGAPINVLDPGDQSV